MFDFLNLKSKEKKIVFRFRRTDIRKRCHWLISSLSKCFSSKIRPIANVWLAIISRKIFGNFELITVEYWSSTSKEHSLLSNRIWFLFNEERRINKQVFKVCNRSLDKRVVCKQNGNVADEYCLMTKNTPSCLDENLV